MSTLNDPTVGPEDFSKSISSKNRIGFLIAGLFGGYSVLLFVIGVCVYLSKDQGAGGFFVFGTVLLGIAALTAIFSLLTRCRLDSNGIHWRRLWHGWRSASWSDVSDYRDLTVSNHRVVNNKRVWFGHMEIVTPVGNLRITEQWGDAATIRDIVRQRATQAMVQDWERFGTRSIDSWPRTFRYWHPVMAWKAAATILLTIAAIGIAVPRYFAFIHWLTSWNGWESTKPIAVSLAVVGALLLLVPGILLTQWLIAYLRRGERFTITPDAFHYSSAARKETVSIPWTEITDYFYTVGGKYTIALRGANERQITWRNTMNDASLLLAVIQRYAPVPMAQIAQVSATEGWRIRNKHEATGGSDPVTWKSGAIGIGGRIFRTRDNRAVLLALLSIGGFFSYTIGSLLLDYWRSDAPKTTAGLLASIIFASVLVMSYVWAWLWFLIHRIETDENGITQITPLTRRHLYWYAVADYKDDCVIGRDNRKLDFNSAMNGYAELKQEIERNAPPPKTGFQKSASVVESPTLVKEPDVSSVEGVQSITVSKPDVQTITAGNANR